MGMRMMSVAMQEHIRERVQYDTNGGCWLWDRALCVGYGQIQHPVHKRLWLAHRLSYEAFFGPIPKGLCVLHKCDNRTCVNPDHLEIGTLQKNALDCYARNRRSPANVVLTAEQVEEAKRLYQWRSPTHGLVALAPRYGVTSQTLGKAVRGTTWKRAAQ